MNQKKYIAVLLASICMAAIALSGCGTSGMDDSTSTPVSSSVEQKSESMAAGAENGELIAGTYSDGSSPQFGSTRLRLTIDGQEVIIRLYENTAVDAFLERLPLEDLNFFDLSGIEKPIERPEEAFSLGEETPGYDPVAGDMVIYRPWGNFTIFYGDFRYSDELVPLGQVESGLEIIASQTEDFQGSLTIIEEENE